MSNEDQLYQCTWYGSTAAGLLGSANMNIPLADAHSSVMLLIGCQDNMPGHTQGSVNRGCTIDLHHNSTQHTPIVGKNMSWDHVLDMYLDLAVDCWKMMQCMHTAEAIDPLTCSQRP